LKERKPAGAIGFMATVKVRAEKGGKDRGGHALAEIIKN